MTPGAILLKLRQKFGHGLGTAYYRDIVRPRILKTPPVEGTTDLRCEIHVLTYSQDWLNLIWTLKSFYAVSGRKNALCIPMTVLWTTLITISFICASEQ